MSQSATPRPRHWLVIALAIVLAAVVALALGIAARDFYHRQAQPAAVPASGITARPTAVPGSPTVVLTDDAVNHPMQQSVRKLLQNYFDAINAKNYHDWTGTVTASRLRDTPRWKWEHDYRTTRDGDILVYRIESVGRNGLVVLLRFVSTQAVADAPADFRHSCIRWRTAFPLTMWEGQWRLDAGATGATPQHDRC